MAANRQAKPGVTPDRSVHMHQAGEFVVVGPRVVCGTECGGVISEPMTDAQAESLIAAGHIAPVEHSEPAADSVESILEEAGQIAIAEKRSKGR